MLDNKLGLTCCKGVVLMIMDIERLRDDLMEYLYSRSFDNEEISLDIAKVECARDNELMLIALRYGIGLDSYRLKSINDKKITRIK